jgi:hypothetical protein
MSSHAIISTYTVDEIGLVLVLCVLIINFSFAVATPICRKTGENHQTVASPWQFVLHNAILSTVVPL